MQSNIQDVLVLGTYDLVDSMVLDVSEADKNAV